jgi:hypothetical protein
MSFLFSKAILSRNTVRENAGGNGRVAGTKDQPRILFVNINFCKYDKGKYAIQWEKRTGGKFDR